MNMHPHQTPRLRPGMRLQFDKARNTYVLQAPERVLVLDAIAHAIVSEIDGARTMADIATILAARYDAPEADIAADIKSLLTDLAEKGYVSL